jgi:hypothetical protein
MQFFPEQHDAEPKNNEVAADMGGVSEVSGDFSSGLGTGLGIAVGILAATWLFTRLVK